MNFQKFLEKFSSIVSWVGVVSALTGFLVFYAGSNERMVNELEITSYSQKDFAEKLDAELKNINVEFAKIEGRTKEMLAGKEKQIEDLKEQQQRLFLLASTQNMDNMTQQRLISDISEQVTTKISKQSFGVADELEKKVKEIEGIIMQNPEKALQIPFMKRDITEIKQSLSTVQNKIDGLKDSLSALEVYKSKVEFLNDKIGQTNNWMIAIFGGLVVSILGLLIGNVFQHRKMTANGN